MLTGQGPEKVGKIPVGRYRSGRPLLWRDLENRYRVYVPEWKPETIYSTSTLEDALDAAGIIAEEEKIPVEVQDFLAHAGRACRWRVYPDKRFEVIAMKVKRPKEAA